jgi:hypothetical protein
MPRCVLVLAALLLAATPVQATPPDASGFTQIGRWTDGPAGDLALDGTVAWYVRGECVAAVDLSDPAHPAPLAMIDLGGHAVDIAARDGWVYALVEGEVIVIDGRRPGHPRDVARLTVFASQWQGRLELAAGVLYCADWELVVVDVREPTRPRVASRVDGMFARDVAAGGGRVFVAGHYGLNVLDATDPLAPTLLEVVNPDGGYSELWRVQVQGEVLFIETRGCLVVQYGLGDDATGGCYVPGLVAAAAVHGDDVYASSYPLARYECPGYENWGDEDAVTRVADLEIAGDLLVTTGGVGGLTVWDLGAGPDPVRLSTLPAGPGIGHLFVDGDRAYAACGWSGLQVFDVSQPRRPRALGSYIDAPTVPIRLRSRADFVAARGDLALLGGPRGLRLIDVSDGASPRWLRDIRTRPDGAELRPLSAQVVDGGWLVSYELDAPSEYRNGFLMVRPQESCEVAIRDVARPFGQDFFNATSDGRLLYATDEAGAFRAWRVTATDALECVGSVATGLPWCTAMTVADGVAYLAGYREVAVIDVRDSAHPLRRGSTGELPWYSNNGITRLAAYDRMVFADYEWGLGLVDATDPDAPVAREGYWPKMFPAALAAGPGEAYIVYPGGGLNVLRAHRAASPAPIAAPAFAGLAVAPNPCNPRTTISFTMAMEGPARVTVHDARGRLVRCLFDGRLDAGPQSLRWSGEDDGGRAVASGVYLVRTATASGDRVAHVTVTR